MQTRAKQERDATRVSKRHPTRESRALARAVQRHGARTAWRKLTAAELDERRAWMAGLGGTTTNIGKV